MKCLSCANEYDNSLNLHCPSCGMKNVSVNVCMNISIGLAQRYKGKSNVKINRRASFEFKGGNEINYSRNIQVNRDYYVDRINNRYIETIVNSKTNEVILHKDEKLSEHNKNKTNNKKLGEPK